MKISKLILCCFLLSLFSACSTDLSLNDDKELEVFDNQRTLYQEVDPGDPGDPPNCCRGLEVSTTYLGFQGLCCKYAISVQNKGNCPIYMERENGKTTLIGANSPGRSYLETVCYYNETITFYFIYNRRKVICKEIELRADCVDCPFTYEQGLQVGCGFGQHEIEGCCNISCSTTLYEETIEKYKVLCPEYVAGVIAGWNACVCTSDPDPDPEECGGEPMPQGSVCECINDSWECG